MPLLTLIWQALKYMYTAVVFYFSGTGNTWWVADRIIRQLDASNINATAVSMDTLSSKKADWWIKSADLILIGWPVYSSDMPEPVKRFIDTLPKNEKGKHVHVFCTQMGFSGDGAWLSHKRLKDKGLIVDTAEHFTMPSNMSMFKGFLATPDETGIKKIMTKTETQVKDYVTRLLTDRARKKGRHSLLLGLVQRGPYRLVKDRAQRRVGVDAARCTHCGLCASLCPVQNITIKTVPEFAGRCAQCLRCYSFCPASAITFYGRKRDIQTEGKPYSIPDRHFNPSLLVK